MAIAAALGRAVRHGLSWAAAVDTNQLSHNQTWVSEGSRTTPAKKWSGHVRLLILVRPGREGRGRELKSALSKPIIRPYLGSLPPIHAP